MIETYATITAQGIDIPMPRVKIDGLLDEGDVLKVGELKLDVWHTPGHTPGQLSFKMGNLLFSGDNIYKDSCVGVIDAHHGSKLPDFIQSLKRILADDSEYLLPSHGPVFRRDATIIQKAIDRLTGYQYMADFGNVRRGLAAVARVGGGRDRGPAAEVLICLRMHPHQVRSALCREHLGPRST